MPIEIDDEDLYEVEEFLNGYLPPSPGTQVTAPSPTVKQLVGAVNKPVQAPPPMNEVERRLDLASYYNAILRESFFDTDSATARKVDEEVRDFVRGRLEELLGIRSAVKQDEGFSKQEFLALRAIAKTVLGKKPPKVQGDTAPQAFQPQPQAFQPQPQAFQPQPQKRVPKLKRVSPPQEGAVQKEQQEPLTLPATALQVEKVEKVEKRSKPLTLGEVFTEDGATYEVIMVGGSLFPKNITKQARSTVSSPIPMPTGPEFENISQMSAMREAASLDRLIGSNSLVASALTQVQHKTDGVTLNG